MIRRRAVPRPAARAHAAAPQSAPPAGAPPRKGPAVRPGNAPRAAPAAPLGETPGPRKSGPRWPGNAAVAAAREHSAVCTARAPGRPPPPEAQLAPARAARRAPGSVPRRPRRRPEGPARTPARLAPRRPPRWPCPRGVHPQGGSIPGRDRLETAAPSHTEKATIKRGINPARKGW